MTSLAAPPVSSSTASTRRRWSTRRRLTAAAAAAAALVAAAGGVYALLTATAYNTTPQDVGSGTLELELTNAGAGFGSAVSNLAPGDAVQRHVTLTSTGTLAGEDLTLAVVDASPTVLSTDATKGLQVTVQRCAQAWDTATGTCGTGATPVGTAALADLDTTPMAVDADVPSGEVLYLQTTLALPDTDEVTVNGALPANTVQGLSAQLTWTFTVGQRTATTTSS